MITKPSDSEKSYKKNVAKKKDQDLFFLGIGGKKSGGEVAVIRGPAIYRKQVVFGCFRDKYRKQLVFVQNVFFNHSFPITYRFCVDINSTFV